MEGEKGEDDEGNGKPFASKPSPLLSPLVAASAGSDAVQEEEEAKPAAKKEEAKSTKKRTRLPSFARTKKPADQPRRPLTGYNIFFREQRALIVAEREAEQGDVGESPNKRQKKEGGNLFAKMGKMIAERWKNVAPDDMARYKAEAKKDTERYHKEMDEYRRKVEEQNRMAAKLKRAEKEKKKREDLARKQEKLLEKHQKESLKPPPKAASPEAEGSALPLDSSHSLQSLSSETRQLLSAARSTVSSQAPSSLIHQVPHQPAPQLPIPQQYLTLHPSLQPHQQSAQLWQQGQQELENRRRQDLEQQLLLQQLYQRQQLANASLLERLLQQQNSQASLPFSLPPQPSSEVAGNVLLGNPVGFDDQLGRGIIQQTGLGQQGAELVHHLQQQQQQQQQLNPSQGLPGEAASRGGGETLDNASESSAALLQALLQQRRDQHEG